MPVPNVPRPKGVPRSWPAMDDIRKEPCSQCGQLVHERSCLAEMTARMNYAEQMAKAATQQAEDAVMRFDECNRANLLLQARVEELTESLAEWKADLESSMAAADWARENGYDAAILKAQAEADAIANAEIVVETTNKGEEG